MRLRHGGDHEQMEGADGERECLTEANAATARRRKSERVCDAGEKLRLSKYIAPEELILN